MLALAAAPAAATPPLPTERIAAGVTAAGVDVSNLTTDEAVQRLEILSDRLERGSVIVMSADLQFKFASADADVVFDTITTAKRALYAGRTARARRSTCRSPCAIRSARCSASPRASTAASVARHATRGRSSRCAACA